LLDVCRADYLTDAFRLIWGAESMGKLGLKHSSVQEHRKLVRAVQTGKAKLLLFM